MKEIPAAAALPLLAIMTKRALNAEEDLLKVIQKDQNKLSTLNSHFFQEIIESQNKKVISSLNEKAICLGWKKLQLSVEQQKMVDEILSYFAAMEKTSQQILFLAESYKECVKGAEL